MDWLDIKEFFIDSIKLIIVIFIILFLMVYVFSITQIVGDSMSPTLKDGNVFILNKIKYKFMEIERGDIVSIDYEDTKYLIKRVVGLPGDTIEIKDNKIYINGKVYEEEYIDENMQYDNFNLSSLGFDKIPQDMYFVLGDNRIDSLDSRKIGLINKSDINGKISFRLWPVNKIGFVK